MSKLAGNAPSVALSIVATDGTTRPAMTMATG
jgi:hypothetical protein